MHGFIKQAFALFMIAVFFAPIKLSAQTLVQGASTPPGKTTSVLDQIRAKMKEKRAPENRAKRWFDALDLDKNEEITKQELFESIRRRFDTMDRTRDKFVSKSEYLILRKDSASGEKRVGALDSNSDGRLSMSEFASPADWRFDRIDRNLDGKVSLSKAALLFDRPVGEALPDEAGECFYVERQVARVKEQVAKELKKRGYPKADCSWTPQVTDELKTKKFAK